VLQFLQVPVAESLADERPDGLPARPGRLDRPFAAVQYDTTGGALESPSTEIASWTYDTLAKGQLTSSTSYSGGAAYTEAVTGYNAYERPSGTQTVIPSAQGALAGTYSQQLTYAPSGQELTYTDSAAGGLPSETVTTGYDSAGEPNALTGTSPYVTSLSYTNLAQPLQYKMGTSGEPAYITNSYDPQTGRVTEQNTQTGTANTSVDDLHYKYDNVGNVLSEADTPSGSSSATDVQCFQYDYLGRMTQAWAQGSTGCAATPSASAEGGAAPYWESYGYATTGNMTGITSTTPAGAVTTTADTYPAAGAAQPHGISTQKVTTSAGSTTSYGYDTAGHLATLTSTAQNEALTWNDQGQLAQVAITPSGGTAKDTSYIYDASNTLLLTTDPAAKTLYLGDEELTENTGTSAVTGTRYYALGGTTVAARTGASTLAYLAGDQQGTSSVAVSSATLAVTHRYYDPYGNTRGTAQPAWPEGEKGFVGGADDTATGLTDLGAREYQPGTGSFISPDPLLSPYNPQDLNAYAYASDNPATNSDPSGAMMITNGGGGGGSVDCSSHPDVVQCPQPAPKPKGKISQPSNTSGTGNRMICNGTHCASVNYFRAHPVKTAPVSRPQTSAKPEFSCSGPYANFRGWSAVCHAVESPSKKPFPWHLVLNVLGGLAAAGCSFATDEVGTSICEDLVNDDETIPDQDNPAPTGRRGSPMEVPRGTNSPVEIDGVSYGGHAIDEMQSEGFTPSIVKDAIYNGQETVGESGRAAFYSRANNITVIVEDGRVVTVSSGELKIR
jgi:RHS repeat-associated protein